MSLILPHQDIDPGASSRIADRVREGEPGVGWRGDPNMRTVLVEADPPRVEVWGLDAHANPYMAASVEILDHGGWREDLLRRLAEGDWQRGMAAYDAIVAKELARAKEANKAKEAVQDEAAEKVAWALRKDVGRELTGLGKDFY